MESGPDVEGQSEQATLPGQWPPAPEQGQATPTQESSGPAKPARRSLLARLFVGPAGIRAGWSLLIYTAIIGAVSLAVFLPATAFVSPRALESMKAMASPGPFALAEAAQVLVVAIATAVMALIERRSPLSYGLAGPRRGGRLLAGVACGFAAISSLVLVLDGLGLVSIAPTGAGVGALTRSGALWAVAMILVALFEETGFRGYVLYTLSRGIGFWPAAIALSAIFGLVHGMNPGESPIGLFGAAAIGFIFCLSLWYTGSLTWAIGFHAAWNWGESYFYGTPDSGTVAAGTLLVTSAHGSALLSGGATGPEGSVLELVLMALIGAAMYWFWGRHQAEPGPLRAS